MGEGTDALLSLLVVVNNLLLVVLELLNLTYPTPMAKGCTAG